MKGITATRATIVAAMALGFGTAPAASADEQGFGFSGRCPIDVIFPISVDAERARAFVPAEYVLGGEAAGKATIFVSLVACEDTVVDGVRRGPALYSDLLFQIEPPPASGVPFAEQIFDAYWAWVVTDERRVHRGLQRLGMFHGFDRRMSVTAERNSGRLVAVDGRVRWRHSPFRIHADVIDSAPLGWPEYFNYFWQDVPGGQMKAKLHKLAGESGFRPEQGQVVAEAARPARFTLTTPSQSRLAYLLGDQCTGETTCEVTGFGAVTELPHFEYDNITVVP